MMRGTAIFLSLIAVSACSDTDRSQLSEADLAARADVASIDFGADEGDFANDGECDDPRFEGPGMTGTMLLEEDIRRDATDCRDAYTKGELTLTENAGS